MDECKFCKDFELTQRVNLRQIRESEKNGIKERFKYRIRLMEYPERFIYSWQTVGEFGHKPVRFFYCPVCGKKLV